MIEENQGIYILAGRALVYQYADRHNRLRSDIRGVTKTRNGKRNGMENGMKRKICNAIYTYLRKT